MSISVIVVTYKRPILIRDCLASLAAQTLKPDEVIVVDNNPPDSPDTEICVYASRLAITCRYQQGKNRSIAAGRNTGIRAAQGETVVFIDDDCIADTQWLEKISAAYLRHPRSSAVGGRIENASPDKRLARLQQYIHTLWFNLLHSPPGAPLSFSRLYSSAQNAHEVSSLTTNNISYKKNIFGAVGYFNERLLTNEDAEFNARLCASGRSIIYEPSAVVYHLHRGSLWQYICQSFAFGRGLRQWGRAGLYNNSLIRLGLRKKARFLAALALYPFFLLFRFRCVADSLIVLPVFLIRETAVCLGYCCGFQGFGSSDYTEPCPSKESGFFALSLQQDYVPPLKGLGEVYEIYSVNRLKKRLLAIDPQGKLYLASRKGVCEEDCRRLEKEICDGGRWIKEKGFVDAPPWRSRPRHGRSAALRHKWILWFARPLLRALVAFEFLWRRKAHMVYYFACKR